MIAAIDAGNTRIKWGLHDGEAWVGNGALPTSDVAQLLDVACQWPADAEVVACNVAGPTVREMVEMMATRSRRRLRWVHAETSAHGVVNGYEQVERLGADRWAAMVGARAKTQEACLVVCAGTATTVDWLDAQGNFRGGLILPGVRLMCEALARDTAQLPLASGEFRQAPRTTMDAIVSGCLHAQAGAIERMFRQSSAEETIARCLVTGGAASQIVPHLGVPWRMEATLILDGLLQYAS